MLVLCCFDSFAMDKQDFDDERRTEGGKLMLAHGHNGKILQTIRFPRNEFPCSIKQC